MLLEADLSSSGIEEGFDHRLINDYRVVRDPRRSRNNPGDEGYSNMEVDDLHQDYDLSSRKSSSKATWGNTITREVLTPGLSSSDTLVMNTPEVDTSGSWTWSRPLLRRT